MGGRGRPDAGAWALVRILFVCERLGERDDEGIRNLAQSLVDYFARRHEVLTITQSPGPKRGDVVAISMDTFQRRTFLSAELLRRSAAFAPEVTLYVPWTSGTLPTFLRGRMLRHATGAPVAIYLTQPYAHPGWQRWFIRYMLPGLVVALSDHVVRDLAQLGAETEFVPAGVDLARFSLPDPAARARARQRFGVAPDQQLILHVGHLNRSRMDEREMAALARHPGRRLVIVGSTSTPHDRELIHGLRRVGCRVIEEYVPDIQSLYAAADAYLFPTRAERSSIGVPLSVLEALASGVPVVSTRFEGLPRLFPATPYVTFYGTLAQLERALLELPTAPEPAARALVEQLDWQHIGATLEQLLTRLTRPQLDGASGRSPASTRA